MIEVADLVGGYGIGSSVYRVLNGVSCTMPKGKITVLAGPNGSGKSTLLKAVCGFLLPWEGTITAVGKPLHEYTLTERAQTIAYVPQSRVVPDILVERLILHGRFPYAGFPHRYTKLDHDIVETVMERLHLTAYADRNLATLSGGQRQKVYLAMALAQDTPVLILDEPLTYLDVRQQLDLIADLKELCRSGKTVCMVIHDLNLALTVADHLVVMAEGAVLAEGSGEAVFESGMIDRAFSVHASRVVSAEGHPLYYFTS
jgi:ABC-type cobalamin/Fe3+-siderophores transport system ATPase subunit